MWRCTIEPAEMSTDLGNGLLARRIAINKDRIQRLSGVATDPTAKLELQRAVDDLNEAESWALRKDLDAWTDLARSVSATIDFVEWRLRTLERVLQARDPDAANTNHRFMPSLALDRAGNLALGYSTSGSASPNFPSIKYAGRLASDPINTVRMPLYRPLNAACRSTVASETWPISLRDPTT